MGGLAEGSSTLAARGGRCAPISGPPAVQAAVSCAIRSRRSMASCWDCVARGVWDRRRVAYFAARSQV